MTESYELIEHSYDVVIVGAGGLRNASRAWHGRIGTESGLCHKSLSDPRPYGGTRWHGHLAR